ncbi:MAG: peptide-methionine (S)-S-oxide reductase MsrA [Thiofilum sp.]|uniref:peptide-methionine (S)-S-oxide reductase MsrA n=1 Tax=Thiofilum sp. TaxID=2212733 RepID=UPI0025D469B7|nr:peptide-methionine (S)-S-oxide reductase MsrA [Thiofilum sp.]MBK8453599.1 peptide-methionine (S)-S-oxide reductase MsrA [Thiofilum sp.]
MFKFKTVLLVASVTLASFSTLAHAKTDTLIVAGGCFWCVESDFEGKTGVLDVVSGYTGGTTPNPTYKQVSHTETGHFEAVQISFDDSKVSLKELVDYYWRTIDPTDPQGQFCDKGSTYRTALFYQTEAQKQVFETSLQELNATKPFAAPVVTQLLPAKPFYVAEGYHQNYYQTNPVRYKYYRWNCGRDTTIEKLWGSVASKASQ